MFYDVHKENMFTINSEDGREAPSKASIYIYVFPGYKHEYIYIFPRYKHENIYISPLDDNHKNMFTFIYI